MATPVKGKDEQLVPIVNIGPVKAKVGVWHAGARHTYEVPAGAVVLAPRRQALGMLRPGKIPGPGGDETKNTDYAHRWDYLRWWDLGLAVADDAGLPEGRGERAREAVKRPIIMERFAEEFDRAGPEWSQCWEPNGVPTVTIRQAQLYINAFQYERWVRSYFALMENKDQARNAGRPFVNDVDALREFMNGRVEYLKSKTHQVNAPRAPFGPGSARARTARMVPPTPAR